MNNLKHIGANIYFEHKVSFLRYELIDLGTFNYNIKALGRNITENFEVLASYEGNRIYINGKLISHDSEILNNIKKVTSFALFEEKTNPTTKKKIDKLYDISDKILNLRKLLWEEGKDDYNKKAKYGKFINT